MRTAWFLAVAVWAATLPARVEAQFFTDNFDTYTTGSTIAGQGGWVTWDNNPLANTIVTNAQSFTTPNSLLIAGVGANQADIVHTFTGVDTGTWHARVRTYVPSTQTGTLMFILLNTYVSGAGTDNWSAQVAFCRVAPCGVIPNGAPIVPGMVTNVGGSGVIGGGTTPLILDTWVDLRVTINFAANQYQVFYNNVLFDTRTWFVAPGVNRLQAMDLYSFDSSQSYMDNAWLDTTVPVEVMSFTVE
jgi:hypothetical protein